MNAGIQKLLASAGIVPKPDAAAAIEQPPAVPAAAGGAAPEAGAADTVPTADATAAAQEANRVGIAAGIAQERERVATVFAAPEAVANPSLAAFLLGNTEAKGEAIVGQLKAAPSAAAAAQPAAAPAAQPTVTGMREDAAASAARDPGNDQNEKKASLEDIFGKDNIAPASGLTDGSKGATLAVPKSI